MTRMPPWAETCMIPRPMVPAPTTPTVTWAAVGSKGMGGLRKGLNSDLCGAGAQQIPGKQHDPQQIDGNGNARLLAEIATAMGEHEAGEDELAGAGNRQHERTHGRVEGAPDQYQADQRDQRAPVAHHDLGERSVQRLAERRMQGSLWRDGGID